MACVIESELKTGHGISGCALRGRKLPACIFSQHPYHHDGLADKVLQLLFFKPVGRECAISAIDEQIQIYGAVSRMSHLVELSVQDGI